jgi:hypothetical protein
MKILFLDCDGVLNDSNDMMVTGDIRPYYVLNYKKIGHLHHIISKTDCKIVVSSSWRIMKDGIETLIRHDIPVFDKTDSLSGPRGNEIQAWLDCHPDVTNYTILDDDSDMLIHQRPHFVQTDSSVGLNEVLAYRAIQRLNLPITPSFDQLLDSVNGDAKTIKTIRDLLNKTYQDKRST